MTDCRIAFAVGEFRTSATGWVMKLPMLVGNQ